MSETFKTLKNIIEGLRITNETIRDLIRRIEELEKKVGRLER